MSSAFFQDISFEAGYLNRVVAKVCLKIQYRVQIRLIHQDIVDDSDGLIPRKRHSLIFKP